MIHCAFVVPSPSTNVLTDSERQKLQEWLDDNKNSSSGSLWFEMLLDSEHTGSF